jgi:hypothetical protein
MRFRSLILVLLTFATITACNSAPTDPKLQSLQQSTTVSTGACDNVGQFIVTPRPITGGMTFEASAAPTHR